LGAGGGWLAPQLLMHRSRWARPRLAGDQVEPGADGSVDRHRDGRMPVCAPRRGPHRPAHDRDHAHEAQVHLRHCTPLPLSTGVVAMKLRIGQLAFGTGRQKIELERGSPPLLSACSRSRGSSHSCRATDCAPPFTDPPFTHAHLGRPACLLPLWPASISPIVTTCHSDRVEECCPLQLLCAADREVCLRLSTHSSQP
jgi:hypothetical protein